MPALKSRVILSAAAIIAFLIFGSLIFSRHSQLASQTTPAVPAAQAAAAQVAAPVRVLPPGTISHTQKTPTTALVVARHFIDQSSYMTVAEFEKAVREANAGASSFKKDQEILVPGIEPQPIVEKMRAFPKDGEVRAVYLTGTMAGSWRGIELIRRWKAAGGNAVVFDIKDSDGTINVPFESPLAPQRRYHAISNLPKFIRFLHSLDMHSIARVALFRDDNIANAKISAPPTSDVTEPSRLPIAYL